MRRPSDMRRGLAAAALALSLSAMGDAPVISARPTPGASGGRHKGKHKDRAKTKAARKARKQQRRK